MGSETVTPWPWQDKKPALFVADVYPSKRETYGGMRHSAGYNANLMHQEQSFSWPLLRRGV